MAAGNFLNYLRTPHWQRQSPWRRAVWQSMNSLGLTGLHVLPLHHNWIETHRRWMPLFGLDDIFDGYRIVQISDLHYSPLVRRGYLSQLFDLVNAQRPDLIVVTGDLVTGGHIFVNGVVNLLKQLHARDQVIVTFGNHDYTMSGNRIKSHGGSLADKLESALEHVGINVLRNERTTITRGKARLTVVGLDDEWTARIDPAKAFSRLHDDHPIICLNHNPANAAELLDFPWQWMLSGHTHGRAVEDIKVAGRQVRKRRPFVRGYYAIGTRHLYVNKGLSYGQRRHSWCKPEITVFRLTGRV